MQSPVSNYSEEPYQQVNETSPITVTTSPPIAYCTRCNGQFEDFEDMACTGRDEYWHVKCFVCAQCFKPFDENLQYYEFGGRKYCEQDFRTLFAPCCFKCNQYIIGRFIRALNKCWHPNCLLCFKCSVPLADQGFIKSGKNALCHGCNILEKTVSKKNKPTCYKCKASIEDEDGPPLKYKNETYHSYHFNCHTCGIELKSDARILDNDLYCLRCHDRLDIPICGACRRPIEERVVTALGKHWHVEHFACTTCEKPFLGKRHFEVKNRAYCEQHYYESFGHRCNACYKIIQEDVVCALNKYYCSNHFSCYYCNGQLVANKSKFFDVESNPCCMKCYRKFPASLRKQLAKQQKLEKKQGTKG